MPVVRDSGWVEREYGREKWPAIERIVDEVTTRESDFGRVLSAVARAERYPNGPLEPVEALFGGARAKVPAAVAFGGYQSLVVDTVLDRCEADTDLVVELGAGWGRNLLFAWLLGGPRSARYVAAEYTAAGRRVAARLAEHAQGLDLVSVPFDYRAPDLSSMPRAANALVFTAHSVEQVALLPEELVDCVRGLADRVTCLHFEPVGWQFRDTQMEGSSRSYAEHHDYSANLAELLHGRAEAGDITLEPPVLEAVGLNPANATTVVAWRSAL
jgi:hypothetical protein